MPRRLQTARLPKSADPPVELLRLETVSVTKDATQPVATVTLNRPKARNALNAQTLRDLEDAFLLLRKRFDVRVVILAGAGASFCAGHDLRSQAEPNRSDTLAESLHHGRQGARTLAAIRDIEAVTIARVQGHAIGGGFGLMQACDLRCVTADAMLYLPELDLGNPVPWGITPMLVRDVGMAMAKELVLTCAEIPAQKAAELGLVNRVCQGEAALEAEVESLAYTVAAKSANALVLAKGQFRSMQHASSVGDVVEYEPEWLLLSRRSRF